MFVPLSSYKIFIKARSTTLLHLSYVYFLNWLVEH